MFRLAARKPLEDAKWALERLEVTEDLQEFRVMWAATVALLRTVGHVLDKVDGASNSKLEVSIRSAWAEWKSDAEVHKIFWNFIEKERNTVLKEYEFNFELGTLQSVVINGEDGVSQLIQELPEWVYVPLSSEDYQGDDARDIAQEAIDWWEGQLDRIELGTLTQN
jgi:hypothetical protein